MSEERHLVKSEEICAVCGKELQTESGRIICKECEENANDGGRANSGTSKVNGIYAERIGK